LPVRLMLHVMPWRASSVWYSSQAYCTEVRDVRIYETQRSILARVLFPLPSSPSSSKTR
jgi:hypothetical protein